MPPKIKITKEAIIQTTLALVQSNGMDAINTRSIASALNCSTQPIFSNFKSMEELHQAVVEATYALYSSFLKREADSGKYPPYKAFGMAYIRFAQEEKELFKLLFMRDRNNEAVILTPDFTDSVDMIMQRNDITKAEAERMHFEMWTCVHGLATMIATSFLTPEWELISEMLTDVYQALRAKYTSKENT